MISIENLYLVSALDGYDVTSIVFINLESAIAASKILSGNVIICQAVDVKNGEIIWKKLDDV